MKKMMAVGVLATMLFAASLGLSQDKVVVTEWQIPFLNCLTGPLQAMDQCISGVQIRQLLTSTKRVGLPVNL